MDEQEQAEHAEVAQAVMESNPDDFSAEHDMSAQAMHVNANSAAALQLYEGQEPGMPPSPVDEEPKKDKKKRKSKKKRGPDTALEIDADVGMPSW